MVEKRNKKPSISLYPPSLLLPVFFWLTLLPALHAESITNPVKNKMSVKCQYGFEQSLQVKTDEGLLIYLDNDYRFLDKIHIELTISDALKKYCDGLAVSLYSNLTPFPKNDVLPTGKIDGKKIFFSVLPYTNRTFIQIPLTGTSLAAASNTQQSQAVKQSLPTGSLAPSSLPPGTLGVAELPKPGDFPLLFLIQPVMKGMPDVILLRDFFINIKAELANKGVLQLTLNQKEKSFKPEELVVQIDESIINLANLPLVLNAGMHKLKLESKIYKEKVVNFSLIPGEQKELQLILEPNKTTLMVDAPQDAIIFLDSNKLNILPGEKMEVAEGEHIIRFKIGNYSSSKKVFIQKGKSYTVNLILDISIKED
jgi:hypothetical protein